MNKEYEMQKCTLELQKKLQENNVSNKSKNTEIAILQNKIASLVQLYRHYDELYGEELSKSASAKIDTVEQVEKLLKVAEKQMASGIISEEHFLEASRKAKENLLTVFRNAGIGQYADLLVGGDEQAQIIDTLEKEEKGERE